MNSCRFFWNHVRFEAQVGNEIHVRLEAEVGNEIHVRLEVEVGNEVHVRLEAEVGNEIHLNRFETSVGDKKIHAYNRNKTFQENKVR